MKRKRAKAKDRTIFSSYNLADACAVRDQVETFIGVNLWLEGKLTVLSDKIWDRASGRTNKDIGLHDVTDAEAAEWIELENRLRQNVKRFRNYCRRHRLKMSV